MSSMRNAAPRRPHRERSQPQARAKWGILEKHKDYSLRAADYNQKKKKLGILSQKSRERNPDEFAFGMLSAEKGKAGKHGRGDKARNQLDHDVVEKLKGQDAGYLRALLGRNRRELDRVGEEIGLDNVMRRSKDLSKLQDGTTHKQIFYDDSEVPRKRQKMDRESVAADPPPDELFHGVEEAAKFVSGRVGQVTEDDLKTSLELGIVSETQYLAGNITEQGDLMDEPQLEATTRKAKSKKQLATEAVALAKRNAEKRRRKKIREARAHKLEVLKKRQRSIMAAASELELQRAKMAKSIGGTNKNGVKFKIRERKR